MPTYEYQCQDCGHTFDVFATFKQKEAGLQPRCPKCQSTETQQAFRSLTFIRSGDGGNVISGPAGCGPSMGPGCC